MKLSLIVRAGFYAEFENHVVTATKLDGYDGKEANDVERQWSFSGSLLYSITVITTIGKFYYDRVGRFVCPHLVGKIGREKKNSNQSRVTAPLRTSARPAGVELLGGAPLICRPIWHAPAVHTS